MAGHEEDSDGSETDVLAFSDLPDPELDGTLEMDRDALIKRLQSDQRSSGKPHKNEPKAGKPPDRSRAETVQVEAINEETQPSKTAKLPAVSAETESFRVPDSVMQELRGPESVESLHTLDIPLEAIDDSEASTDSLPTDEIVEFTAVIDRDGRVRLPEAAVQGRFKSGRRVYIVMRLSDD
jgi:hypothetical protein